MATFAATDLRVEINGVDMSQFVTSVELPIEHEELTDTAMGDSAQSRLAGLQDSTISLAFNADFAANAVDQTLWPLLGTTTTIKVRPTSAAISSTNPEYVADYLISKYPPFGNEVGEKATVEVEWPLSDGDGIARNTI